ncbi:hypothetical protein G6514_002195 [Epicoccum nigrum]|nr:hypothetical protein G6514_002195 [Epicoccum nigrum]
MPSPDHPTIAIIGAGPVSLTLASILQNNNIPFTIYEAASSVRTQGGSLDLHPTSGQLALKEAGLWDAFTKLSRPESDVQKIVELGGEVLWDGNTIDKQDKKEDARFEGRPEIDRRALVNLLFENLDANAIVFGKKVERIIPSPSSSDTDKGDASHTLLFTDATNAGPYSLIIGCDGAWSPTRSFLSPTKPAYSGISMACASISTAAGGSWLSEYVGAGTLFSFGADTGVIAQRGDAGFVSVYACLRCAEGLLQQCGIDWSDGDGARAQFMERFFGHVHPDLRRVFLSATDEVVPRALYELPVGFGWEHREGVTLAGDAAHLMTPFAGVGVNVGMEDALVLGRGIVGAWKGGKGLDGAVRAYEEEMVPRAARCAEKTWRNKDKRFREGGAEDFARMLREAYGAVKG